MNNRCPNCGGETKLDAFKQFATCLYCGCQTIIKEILFSAKTSDTFEIPGRGVVVSCNITEGEISVNDNVQIVDINENISKEAKVIGIEKARKKVEKASKGDAVGLLLEGVTKGDLKQIHKLLINKTIRGWD